MSVYKDIVTVRSGSKIVSNNVIFSIASLVFSLILFFVLILPGYKEMKLIEVEGNLKNASLQDKKSTLDEILRFNKEAVKITDIEKGKINMFLPEENVVDYDLANIDNLSSFNKLRLEKVVISDKIEKNVIQGGDVEKKELVLNDKELKKNKITFSVSGSYKNIVSFAKSLEKSIPLIELNSIKIKTKENNNNEKKEASSGEKVLEAEMSFTMYYL